MKDVKIKDEEKEEKFSIKECIKNLKIAIKYASKEKRIFISFVVISLVSAIIGTVTPIISARQITALNNNVFKTLIILSIALLAINLIDSILSEIIIRLRMIFQHKIKKLLQIDMAKALLNMEAEDIKKESGGIFINRLTSDVYDVSNVFFNLSFSINNFITNFGTLLVIFFISKVLFIYFIISMIIIFIINSIRSKKNYKLDQKYRNNTDKTTGFINEIVRGVFDIKILNAEDSFTNKLDDILEENYNQRIEMDNTSRIYYMIMRAIEDLIELGLILISVLLIKNNYLTAANFMIIFMYRHRAFSFISMFNYLIDDFKRFTLSSTRVFQMLGSDEYRQEKFGDVELEKIKGDFEFKDVHFSYDDKKEVLKGVSFKVKHNETVSFVGKSGAGKTTIFNLLSKLYSPNEGEIFIDGIPINKLSKNSLRGNISIISQNPYIFNMTIKENFQIIKENVSDSEIVKACKMAALHDFIETLPDGYDTLLGEGGINLSGGQRQRMAIARALLQKTEIILFDEATSSLDNETQKSIQDAINNMKNKYTILIIAHRLSTVINSDRIMMLDNGKIVANGTHEELIKNNEKYKKLYELELIKRND